MSKVAIVTDSTATIPTDLMEQYPLWEVPQVLIFGEEVLEDRRPEDRSLPAAEEQRGGEGGHVEEVDVLGEEEEGEPETGVLGVEPADDLLLGLHEVERGTVGLGEGRDDEDHE